VKTRIAAPVAIAAAVAVVGVAFAGQDRYAPKAPDGSSMGRSASVLTVAAAAPVPVAGEAAPVFAVQVPPGYRDWKLVSVAHEEGDLNDLRAILGNDVAIEAYRERTPSFPDGAILVRLAWKRVASEENNRVFGRAQSFVAGAPTNVQIMVKDSGKYAGTGGWGFAEFADGRPPDAAVHEACAVCHAPDNAPDAVFTRYSP
jgi:hypothetical protein